MFAAALGCARPAPPRVAGDADRVALARVEARREGGSAELVRRSAGPPGPEVMLAIRGLGRVGDGPALARLLALLDGPEPGVRAAAARALDVAAALGAEVPALEPALLRRLPTAAGRERVAIVEGLRRVGGPASVPLLGGVLGPDEPGEVREAAAIALGIFGRREVGLDAATRAGLVALAGERDRHLRYAAAYALAHEHTGAAGERGRDDAAAAGDAALLRLARAQDAETRALALKGLGRRGGAAGAAALQEGLGDGDPWVRVAAVRGLAQRGDEASIAALWTWLQAALESVDRAEGTGAIHPVLEAMSLMTSRPGAPEGAAASHARAEERLGQGTTGASPAEARIACGLAALAARRAEWRPPLVCAGAVGAEADRERRVAETGLIGQGWGGPVEARIERLRALAGEPDPLVRAAAITAAARAWEAEPAAVEGLVAAALGDASPAVAGAAAEAVQARFAGAGAARAGGAGSLVDALVRRASEERDDELFAALAGALGVVGGARGVAICEAALRRASPSARAAARACVKVARGVDPGATGPAEAVRLPPHDPSALPAGPLLWRLTTGRGRVDIALEPDVAPWHVAAVVTLTRAGSYDGLVFHRVVPGYVVQGGDPQGTGWGGPGFSLPSEPGEGRFDRGAVGVADAGKDTGGSQFFIMHARAPHLEGRYTRIGRVRAGLETVDALIVGDRIVAAEILSP